MAWWLWLLVQLVVWCCAGLVALLWWKWANKPHIDAPGPPTLPIIGNILDFLEMPLTLHKIFDLHRQYGDLTRLYVGPMLLVTVAHPDDVQHVLLTSKLIDRGTLCTNAMRAFVGDGLVTIDVSRWKVHRKLINPTFHSEMMILRPWMQNKFLLQLTSKGRGVFKFVKIMQDWALKCIAMGSAATEDGPTKTRQRLLEALLKPGNQTAVPLDEVQGELMNLLIAGTETTAVTVSYTLALLALHPEWQDAAHQELKDVFGEGDDYLRAPSLADLGRLRVLESIIKETLRLFPTVPILPRMATGDLWLSGGSGRKVLVPEGTLLLVMPFLTHRLPQFFQDPQQFDPSRFLEDRVGKEHACTYLPFGLGARSCVGSQYSRLQLKVYLSDILKRFRFLPCSQREDLDDSALAFSLNPVKPIRVSCIPVDGCNT
ncbi:cytochrome P450 4C1-like isoform X2 [Schistocerca piceifrons]|uniref:cytochrome P450 4C1-like isoform X2 n=1 Tax=Schistocerca piceifrons TaxID=274613 RepID=UPI001F5E8CA7|nr:cytochrome P450 4C1-like isoform X2 [Schistocerca piceifrons]